MFCLYYQIDKLNHINKVRKNTLWHKNRNGASETDVLTLKLLKIKTNNTASKNQAM